MKCPDNTPDLLNTFRKTGHGPYIFYELLVNNNHFE